MKKLILLLLCLTFILAGCGKANDNDIQVTTAPTVAQIPIESTQVLPSQETMYSVSVPMISENTLAEDGTVIFSYNHQDMMLILPDPDVADKIIIDFLTRVDTTASSADTLRQSAEVNYNGSADWTPYLYNITYNPMRMDQGVLSLFGSCVTYTGASHPERLNTAASYDLVTGDILTLASIMSTQATTDDFCDLVLKKLAAIKEDKYLYEGYENTVKQRFMQDESQDQDWYFSTSGLCFYFVPYEIAPYSSGVITVEIPYNELIGLMYDGYFPPERTPGIGELKAAKMGETDFTQNSELVLDPDGQMVFLHTDGVLWDVSVEYGAWDLMNAIFTPVYTALFSSSLTPGDAIMLQTNELTSLRITYKNETGTVTQHFNQSGNDFQLMS